MSDVNEILIFGAKSNNLKNLDLSIPRDKLVVITGLSGSGKSSLAFDTLYAEGQRRYVETFSAYARQFLSKLERPDVDKIEGLSPVISIEQKTVNKSPRSTVGTTTEIYDFLRLLYSRCSEAYSYVTNKKMVSYTSEQILELIESIYIDKKIILFFNMSDFIFSIKTPKKKAAGIKLKSHLSWPVFNPKNPIKKLKYNQIDIKRKAKDFSLPFGR